jgi:hypothetical protein
VFYQQLGENHWAAGDLPFVLQNCLLFLKTRRRHEFLLMTASFEKRPPLFATLIMESAAGTRRSVSVLEVPEFLPVSAHPAW